MRFPLLRLLATYLFLVSSFSHATLTFPLSYREHESVSAARLHDDRRRALLGSAATDLGGSVLEKGYFFVTVQLGTPPQQFALIVDTGSTLTYVPCSSCIQCGQHQDQTFQFAQSSSYQAVTCFDGMCEGHSCDVNQQCTYVRHYAEASSTSGLIATDILNFIGQSSLNGPSRVYFGCETRETGDLYTQQADGIMGLGKGPMSVITQLSGQGVIDDVFSLCYGGMSDGGGAMMVGGTETPSDMIFTSYDSSRPYSMYYVINVDNLRINGKVVDAGPNAFGQGYGNVLDSGTTFTYLPPTVFSAFKDMFIKEANLNRVAGPDPSFEDICFAGASDDPSELSKYFPSVSFDLGGGVALPLDPENYLFKHRLVPGGYCLGMFANSDRGALIGGITTRNFLVRYDRAQGRIGFAKRSCSTFLSAQTAPPITPPPTQTTTPPVQTTNPPVNATTRSPQNTTAPVVPGSTNSPAPTNATELNKPTPTSTGCPDCVAQVLVDMKLATDFDTFPAKIPGFVTAMANDLQLLPEQVKILSYQRGSVLLHLAIIPPPLVASSLLAPSTAAAIEETLRGHRLHLQEDTYGTYEVQNVQKVKPQDQQALAFQGSPDSGGSSSVGIVIAVVLVVALIGVGAAYGLTWGYRHWKERGGGQYTRTDLSDSRRVSEIAEDSMVAL